MAGGFQGVFLAQAQRRSLWLSLRLCAFAGKYSPDPADDRLGLSYSKQELDDEIAGSVSPEHEYRQWRRMPAGDQHFESPTNAGPQQRSCPQFCGIRK